MKGLLLFSHNVPKLIRRPNGELYRHWLAIHCDRSGVGDPVEAEDGDSAAIDYLADHPGLAAPSDNGSTRWRIDT